ncbi:chromosome partitioning protein ParB [Aphanothece hegewaldii CCALA 016]|uniref:Chromosome partitioning protein ParB n=1 Tax=Aphanothece hegewaldii CCALA 016 TaxID=2107694 RepID=A0A2T1LR23_9CHRO|nr:ParB/RepB/Spo0J family partition protein [Aphanothece hegewaldii]PSF30495.1 chromosome partitioning protein ParB [Aphanothece hegewaldii CCALA 016]
MATKERRSLNVFTFREGHQNDYQIVPFSQLVPFTHQPRKFFNPIKLAELAATIKKHGILEPLLVRLMNDGQHYEILSGERRYRAGLLAGVNEARVLVLEVDDEEAIEISLLDNLQREDLNPVEEVEGILNLLSFKLKISREQVKSTLYRLQKERKGQTAHNVVGNAQIEVITSIFKSLGLLNLDSFINHRLSLLNLPEDILRTLGEGKIEYTKAKVIARLKDSEQRTELLEDVIAQELSLSQIKERISLLESRESNPLTPTAQTTLSETYQKLKKAQLWKTDPKKWRKAQTLLKKLEELLNEEIEE